MQMECMPQDVLLGVMSFLHVEGVCRVAATSHKLHATCASPALWEALCGRDFDPREEDRLNPFSAMTYAARLRRIRSRQAARAQTRDRIRSLQIAGLSQAALGWRLAAVAIAGLVLLPYLLLLAFVALVAAKLDFDSLGLSWLGGWAAAFLPAWLLVAILAAWLLFLGYLAVMNASITDRSSWYGQLGRLSWLPCQGFVTSVIPARPAAAALAFAVASFLAIQLGLLCAKISLAGTVSSFKWGWVALPLWLAIAALAAGSVASLRGLSRDGLRGLAAAWGIIGCPIVIAAIVLVVALDTGSSESADSAQSSGLGIPLRLVLIPLWALGG